LRQASSLKSILTMKNTLKFLPECNNECKPQSGTQRTTAFNQKMPPLAGRFWKIVAKKRGNDAKA